ncbi:CopG family ribbon-helix-helix protein [Methyloprofundus sp.]|uniref:CopG family ribbon-helix-helix protein n=1 Tax=Methyloprofundus sp. TaxID=2020875 RepID=UPI003D0A6C2B
MAMTQFSMRLPEELKNSLKEISSITHRSQSQIAAKAITEYVERNEWKIKAIADAVKEADKGVFISHESMEAWVDSIGTKNELEPPKADIFPNS